jgi:hypothetical protein
MEIVVRSVMPSRETIRTGEMNKLVGVIYKCRGNNAAMQAAHKLSAGLRLDEKQWCELIAEVEGDE